MVIRSRKQANRQGKRVAVGRSFRRVLLNILPSQRFVLIDRVRSPSIVAEVSAASDPKTEVFRNKQPRILENGRPGK